MILEPNRQRRQRAFRVVAGVVVVLFVAAILASGWTLPAFSIATATPSMAPLPTATTAPVAIVPTPSPASTVPPPPTPAPTKGPDGCFPAPTDLQPATAVSHGPRDRKWIALTFDDGNNPDNVARILRILMSRKANATFFPTARSVDLAPETWLKVARAGYPIGNHTYHHQSLAGLCFEAQLAELRLAKTKFDNHAVPMQGFMRPPYEEFDRDTKVAATAAGEPYMVLWDVDTRDWTGLRRNAITTRALQGGPGSIILMHTTNESTAWALLSIIPKYRERGFTFVTIGQLLGVAGPVPFG